MRRWLISNWYKGSKCLYVLIPFSWLYRCVIKLRRYCYQLGIKKTTRLNIPVVVIGNLTLGGTGKTPLAIYLAKCLAEQGYQVGIVSRGYQGKYKEKFKQVYPQSSPADVGEEAILLARNLPNIPVVVSRNRVLGALFLQNQLNCQVVLSDDGLQHYALERDIEILVIDGLRRFGNGLCLPAGPLREPISRGQTVDFCIVNGGAVNGPTEFPMQWLPGSWVNLKKPALQLSMEAGMGAHVVTGIGNSDRFLNQVKNLGFEVIPHVFPDHHFFRKSDFSLNFNQASLVLMTEKDAIKCFDFADERYWYLNAEVVVPPQFKQLFISKLNGIVKSSQSY